MPKTLFAALVVFVLFANYDINAQQRDNAPLQLGLQPPVSLKQRPSTSASGTFFWGQDFLANPTEPVRQYVPVDPAKMPVDWDPRSDKVRMLMATLNASICPQGTNFINCWQMSPPHPVNPLRRADWMEVMAIFYEENGTITNRITQGKLPRDYGRELFEASKDPRSGVVRADCDTAWFEFTNIKPGMPLGPYPIVNWGNQLRGSEFIDTVPRPESKPGYGTHQIMVDVYRGQVRIALPEVIFTEWSANPIARVDAFHSRRALQSQRLPKGAPGLYTIPDNEDRGYENDFRRARATGQLRLAVLVKKGECPSFDYARYLQKQPVGG